MYYTDVNIKKRASICMLAVCPHYPGRGASCVSLSCAVVKR